MGVRVSLALFALTLAAAVPAQDIPRAQPAKLAILIDDLGVSLAEGRRVLRLPGPVACAILPHQPFSRRLAEEARASRKEVLLHLPMESEEPHETGPGVIDATMPPLEIRAALDYNLETVPHAAGINNHMGSHLTRQREPMQWLMQVMRHRGNLFFVDSRTTPASVAADAARAEGIPTLVRDVFLDNERDAGKIEHQLDELVRLARTRGQALAIGHPYPETLAVLERRLPQLQAAGIELVPLTGLLAHVPPEKSAWPSYSSR
jgi:polysaccharide deacetylase 2 family uncharacterized protein YibQ